ncbi:DUF1127 domain-containing protein [Brucella pecoris]
MQTSSQTYGLPRLLPSSQLAQLAMKWTEPMFYFRPQTETIDTILPVPVADSITDLPKGLQVNLTTASRPQVGYISRFLDWVSYRMMLRRSRIALSELTDDQLRDIGLQREEAEREARKVRFHLR